MEAETRMLKVARYRPEKGPKQYWQEYKVPYQKDTVVLDALNQVKAEQDGTLAYRWSCRMGVCGSCGANINGVPRLTCETFLHEFKEQELVIQPLANFPVVNDLVVNFEDFMEKLVRVKPCIIRDYESPLEEHDYNTSPSTEREATYSP